MTKTINIDHLLTGLHTMQPGRAVTAPDFQAPLTDFQRARLGKVTGSNFHKVTFGRGGKGWSQTAESYLYELVWEWLSGRPASNFDGNRATEWGNQHEAEAIRLYSEKTGQKVKKGVFHEAPGFQGLVGCTPDAVGKKGLEVKCPYSPKNHLRTVITQTVPTEYTDQVMGHMLCTGRYYCDFVSYDPRLPDPHRMVVVEVEASPAEMSELRDRLEQFEAHLIETLEKIEIDWTAPNWAI
jgi:YqaJ-like viral recombinase domain